MKRSSLSLLLPATASLMAVAFQPSATAASVTYTGTASQGKWNVASNWTPATVPVNGDDVFLIQSGSRAITVDLNQTYSGTGLASLFVNSTGAGALTLNASKNLVVSGDEIIGSGGKGAFNQNSGKHVAGQLILGAAEATDVGTYVLKKGSLSVLTNLALGIEGQGVFTQRSGSVGVGGDLVLADNVDAQASYTLNNGTLNVSGVTIVGDEGIAYFTQSRGKSNHGGIVIGLSASGEGLLTMNNGKMTSGSVIVGDEGLGEFRQSRGTHTVQGDVTLAATGGEGKYALGGGALNVGGNLIIGQDGTGVFQQTGGKVTVTGSVTVTNGTYDMTDSSLTTDGISVEAGGEFLTSGTASRIRTTGDFLIDELGGADLGAAELIVAKGAQISLSVNNEFEDGIALRKLSLERNITLSLEGDLGNALYVDEFNIGSNNMLRLDSIVFGNGIDIYYNADNEENRYLLGLSYNLGNGGRLIPVFLEDDEDALAAGLTFEVHNSLSSADVLNVSSASGTLSESSFSSPGTVPEPTTALLAGAGLAALLLRRRAGR